MRGSGVAIASSIEEIVGRGSYVTLTLSAASQAASSVVAATAATGSPTKRTLSGQRACSSCETGRMPNGIGVSLPVRKPRKPGTFSASEKSIARINACGCVERTSRTQAVRGKARSSANLVAPVTLARPSTRRNGLPMMLVSRCGSSSGSGFSSGSAMMIVPVVVPIKGFVRGCPVLAAHPGGGPFHPFEDLEIAGAAAEVAGERLADFFAAWGWVLGEQGFGGHQDARRAVAALGGAEVGEGGLEGMELVAELHPLDRLDRFAARLGGEHQTGEHGTAVHQHRAGAALAELAAVLGAGQRALLAQHLEQRVVGGEDHGAILAVDPQPQGGQVVVHSSSGLSNSTPAAKTPRPRSSACSRPISRADLRPSGRNHFTVQLTAPRMARALTLGSTGRKTPAAIPSWMVSRKERSYSSRRSCTSRRHVSPSASTSRWASEPGVPSLRRTTCSSIIRKRRASARRPVSRTRAAISSRPARASSWTKARSSSLSLK